MPVACSKMQRGKRLTGVTIALCLATIICSTLARGCGSDIKLTLKLVPPGTKEFHFQTGGRTLVLDIEKLWFGKNGIERYQNPIERVVSHVEWSEPFFIKYIGANGNKTYSYHWPQLDNNEVLNKTTQYGGGAIMKLEWRSTIL